MVRMPRINDGCVKASRPRQVRTGLLLLALSACGRTAAGPGGPDADVTSDASSIDSSGGYTGQTGGNGPASTGGAGGSGAGSAGGVGGGALAGPSVDISGRWGLYTFEDPVGVQLRQATDGILTGEGCAGGTPGSTDPGLSLPLFGCGKVSGRVVGRTASFVLPVADLSFWYRLDVTVSTDGSRMAGTLTTSGGRYDYPVALQRVRNEARGLDLRSTPESEALDGTYELTLIPAASTGTEFVPGTAYKLFYWDRTIGGHLGSFWNNEISPISDGSPLRAGPVAATVPELPTSLVLDFEGTTFSTVTAETASGGRYQFSARRLVGP
jgi:hypothetical protein